MPIETVVNKIPLVESEVLEGKRLEGKRLEGKRLEDIGLDMSMNEKIDIKTIVQTVDILYLRNKTVIISHICSNPI